MEAQPSRLRELLEELHAELSRNAPFDERGRELVRRLREDIARYDSAGSLPGASAAPAAGGELPPQGLRGRLQEMIVGLEESHPQLAATIEQAMVALSNMGL